MRATAAAVGISAPFSAIAREISAAQVLPVRSPGTPRSTMITAVARLIANMISAASGAHSRIRFHFPRKRRPTASRHEVRSTSFATTTEAIVGANIPAPITSVYSGWAMPPSSTQNGAAQSASRP